MSLEKAKKNSLKGIYSDRRQGGKSFIDRVGPIKVAFLSVIPTPYRNPLINKLLERDEINLKVYYMGESEPDRNWKPEVSEDKNITFLAGKSIVFRGKTFHINPGIVKELRRNKFDVVVVSGYSNPTALAAIIWCQLNKTPYILLSESHLLKPRGILRKLIKGTIIKLLIRKASAYLATGSYSKEHFTFYGANEKKIFIFPNTPDVDYFEQESSRYSKNKDKIKEEIGITTKKIISYVGRLVETKGVDILIKSFGLLISDINDVSLMIVGDGHLRGPLEKISRDSAIEDVHFVSFKQLDELPKYYVISDLFVLCSSEEPWGVVVNEAMACGLPVVVTRRVGAAGDLVRNGENGFIVKENDVEGLSQAMKKIIGNEKLRKQMGIRSREIIKDWKYQKGIKNFLKAIECVSSSYK